MTDEGKRKAIALIEANFRIAGGKGWEESTSSMATFFEALAAEIRKMQTPELFMQMVDSWGPMTKKQEMMFLVALRYIPQVVRRGLCVLATSAAPLLPNPPGGRPDSLDGAQEQKVCDYVAERIRQGLSVEDAKHGAAQNFGCSVRTVERAWSRRSGEPSKSPGFEDAWEFMTGNDGALPRK